MPTDEIIIKFSVNDDGSPKIEKLNQTLGKTKEASQSLLPGFEKARQGLTGFISANAGLIAALTGVGLALNKIVKDELAYTDQIRTLSTLSGLGAEETSRFIQVLDDYKISADDAMLATRTLTSKGLAPSIETLAKLSEKYRSLTSVEEKNKFVLENLGRGGVKWIEVLNKGSAAILKQGDAVDDLLLRNEEQLEQARKLQIAQDNLGESWEKASGIVATKVIPAASALVNGFLDLARANELAKESGEEWFGGFLDVPQKFRDMAEAERIAAEEALTATTAFEGEGESLEKMIDPAKAAADALQAISDKNQALLSLTEQLGDFQKQYEEDHKQGVEDITAAQLALNEAVAEYGANSEEAFDASEQLDETREALGELEASWHESTQRMIYDMIITKLSIDGLTDSEFEAAIQIGITSGIYTEATAKMARDMWALTDTIVAGIHYTEKLGNAAQIASQKYNNLSTSMNGATSGQLSGDKQGGSRDSGGVGIAGTSYLIGTGAQPEMFTPSVNGTFTPNANKGNGQTIVININNPKGETAENSIRKALKLASVTGAFS